MKMINSLLSIASSGFGAFLIVVTPAFADTPLFFDDFNGPTLNSAWQASLPNANIAFPIGILGGPQSAAYQGAPNYSFQTLGGNSVLRMTDNLGNLQRRGWSSSSTFNPSAFTYDVRFNTLIQSNTTSIDSFIEVWILDPTNPNRYDMVTLFGNSYSYDHQFAVGSSIDNTFDSQAFDYQNNTWYHLVIQDLPGQDISVSLDNDSGGILALQTLNHTEGAYGSGFEIALSQGMGFPQGTYPSDVAVDYAKLTVVPEPSSVVLIGTSLIYFCVVQKRRSAKISSISRPTLPVAPTTATLRLLRAKVCPKNAFRSPVVIAATLSDVPSTGRP